MRAPSYGRAADKPPALTAPAACPACGSANIAANAKAITAGTYWRCKGCGEIWNAGRWRSDPPGRRW